MGFDCIVYIIQKFIFKEITSELIARFADYFCVLDIIYVAIYQMLLCAFEQASFQDFSFSKAQKEG
ncbi:hypothetical protein D3C86_2176080 [compost metagenome]